MISCLLFDLDGTLFDSSEANILAYSQAFKESGLSFDTNLYKKEFGLRFIEMMDKIAPESSQEQRAQIKELKAQFYKSNLSLVKPNQGLLSLLKSLPDSYKTALVTTASKTNVLNLFDFFDIDLGMFNVVITGEDVKVGKPNPECYNLALKALGKKPEEALVFEDSDVGIIAAEKAGAFFIKVKL